MNRPEACDILEELVGSWRERDRDVTEEVISVLQSVGFEFGLRFALNYPEYAVALRDALDNCESEGDGSDKRFLMAAADIIAAHPIGAKA